MDPEDESGPAGHGQNLHDLQNYLSTFNKEIEPGDDVLSNMDVDSGVGDVSDLYSSNPGNPLQEPGEGGVASQFSSGFYSEQGILDSSLSDEPTQQIQNMVSEADRDADGDITIAIKQEVGSIDLGSVQAQIAGLGDGQLSHNMGDIHTSPIPQGLIMTSLGDNLDPSAGKVIRIVSLGEEGQFLSITDGSQMQILSQDLGMSSDTLGTPDGAIGTEATSVSTGSPHATSILASVGSTNVVLASRGNIISTASDSTNSTITGGAQLVALQSTSDSTQPQLVTLPQGTALNTETLQISGLLAGDGAIGSELGYQTITILPSELNQSGDMNYFLIMASQDAQKDGVQPLAQVVEDLKQENQELSEELMEINGEMKRVLRVIPKKFMTSNFGAQLMCGYCDYTSQKRYLLTRHMKSHSDERPHKCKECDRGFKTPASLLNHINTHTGTRPHKCKTCDAAFTTSGELVRHIRYRHTFEKPHRCPNCDYASVELSKLKRHMRSHTGERPYKCPNCPYASPDTYKLKRHLRIHTGEKPYECDICHAKFTQSNSLKAHKLIHSGNKPVFQCDLCPTTCGRKTDLKIHFNKLHSMGSPLECKKCGQIFSDRYSYKQHVRGHDVDKCLKCDECDFVTNTEHACDLHAAVHSNGKKFECDVCHSSFNLKQSLDKHKHSCHLGVESGIDSPSSSSSSSRDKEQNRGDGLFSVDISNSSSTTSGQLVTGPLASDTLHRNLIQDIKAGKLGDVPQVVIVHPDGSLEEISSKGDKLNQEVIFSALSSSHKAEVRLESRESSQAKGNNNGDDGSRTISSKCMEGKEEISDEDDDEEDEEENCETSQCEAGTQVELESDIDSLDENSSAHFPTTALKGQQILSSSSLQTTGEQSASSDIDSTPVNITETSSDALRSLLQTMTTSTTPTSSSLLPLSTDQTAVSGQQFVVVKGYTCLSSDTAHPTLVNVALDKESLMKMFASLATPGDGGMQLLTGDLESPVALSIENSPAAVVPMTPIHLSSIPGLNSSLIVGANFDQVDDSTIVQDQELIKNDLISINSNDISKDILSPKVDSGTDSQSMSNTLTSSEPTYTGIGIFANSLTSADLNGHTEITSVSTPSPPFVSLKVSLSSEHLAPVHRQSPEGEKSVKASLSDEQLQSDLQDSSKCDSTAVKVCLSDEHLESDEIHNNMKSILDNDSAEVTANTAWQVSPTTSKLSGSSFSISCPLLSTETSSSQALLDIPLAICPHDLESPAEDSITENIPGNAPLGDIKDRLILSQEKHKSRSSRKRLTTADIDPSLVMTGKRVRKTLIKVSM